MTSDAGIPEAERLALAAQLSRLERMERHDPVYREMLALAAARTLGGQPIPPAHHWGDYSACGDPAKRRSPARVGADGLTMRQREAAIDAGQIRLTR